MGSFYTFFVKRLLLIGLIIMSTSLSYAQVQTFKNGAGEGVIKVKFKPTLTSTLSSMKVQVRGNVLTTGIANVDKTNKSVKAQKMERLIPYDAKHESKYKKHGLDLWYIIYFDDTTDARTAVSMYSQLREVDVAELVYEKKIAPTKANPYKKPLVSTKANLPFNDPILKDQWHYTNTVNQGFPDGTHINLLEAWSKIAGRSDVIVAIHDNGTDLDHEDLKANLWVNKAEANGVAGADDDGNQYKDDIHGWNFVDDSPSLTPSVHGTHVAGTVAAVNNNGIGVAGVAGGTGNNDGAKLMALQIIGSNPQPAAIERSFTYAANNGAVISQNSWGYDQVGVFEQSVLDAIDYFIEFAGSDPNSPMKGGIVIFAAGNDNKEGEWYPAYYDKTFSVSALGPEWKKASYSNYGSWVEISAPGGDADVYGTAYGVLSTYPNNDYGYLDGTSMACPHVSGIAALIVANSNGTITNEAVWNKLQQGTIDGIDLDAMNPNHAGKLGKGAIDAAMAVRDDAQISPEKITALTLKGIANDMAMFTWPVPADEDDDYPSSFRLYYSTKEIAETDLASTKYVPLSNTKPVGTILELVVPDLAANTKYWFSVVSYDRWGNASKLSNIIESTTDLSPIIGAETGNSTQSIKQTIDVRESAKVTNTFKLLNKGKGILSWNSTIRDVSHTQDYTEYKRTVQLPSVKSHSTPNLVSTDVEKVERFSAEKKVSTFTSWPKEKRYYANLSRYIGDLDIDIPNSSATRFYVDDENGFNITSVKHIVKYKSSLKSLVIEIYEGETIQNATLIYDEEYPMLGDFTGEKEFIFKEQVLIEKGKYFWVVLHVPSGQETPLVTGTTDDVENADFCYYSGDLGQSWVLLANTSSSYAERVWTSTAISKNDALGEYVALSPIKGYIEGTTESPKAEDITLDIDASQMVNGTYKSNITFRSNDPQNPALKIPVEIKVTGHKAQILYPAYADFSNIFVGLSKTIEIEIENIGLGRMNSINMTVDNTAFMIDSHPNQLEAKSSGIIKLIFSPTTSGTHNGVLTISNNNGHKYEISLVGIGAETPTMNVSPLEQTVVVPTIGDKVSAEIEIENTGKYPLQYFVPGYDTKGISKDWPTAYPIYGYEKRYSTATSNTLPYEFKDISTTGISIKDKVQNNKYATVDFGFDFPFYDTIQTQAHIASNGFVSFDKTITPSNAPTPGNETQPKGLISIFGERLSYPVGSDLFYKVEPDKLIIQYHKVGHSGNYSFTAQMVLFVNGDIRFYYDNVTGTDFYLNYINIFIEDTKQSDAVAIRLNGDNENFPASGIAYGFDYPGPAVIESLENGSNTLSPGKKAVMKVNLKTDDLVEGVTKRYINIISNDPDAVSTNSLINLDVQSGGAPVFVLTPTEIDFGTIYKDVKYTDLFKIRNTGNKDATIVSMTFANDKFTVTGNDTIEAKLTKEYTVTAKTDAVGDFTDQLTITFSDGSKQTLTLSADILPAPVATINTTLLEETLNKGARSSHDFEIKNTGGSNLVLSTIATPWARFVQNETDSKEVTEYDYTYKPYITSSEAPYSWIDIIETGTKAPDLLIENPYLAWSWLALDLPFEFEFYGEKYKKMYITGNGIIGLGEEPNHQMSPPGELPTKDLGTYIMPFWFSAFENPTAKGATGLYYQSFNSADMSDTNTDNHDMYVISWADMISGSGVGNGVDIQLTIYKTGNIQVQMRMVGDDGNDVVSQTGVVAIQKGESFMPISFRTRFEIGKGKSFYITPNNKYTLAAGEKLSGKIHFDAASVNAGIYEDSISILSNDPLAKNLKKPVKLTINGTSEIDFPEVIDFGEKENGLGGTSLTYDLDVVIKNTGSQVLELNNMSGSGVNNSMFMYQVLYQSDGQATWKWTNIMNLYGLPFPRPKPNPVFKVKPGESFIIKATLTAMAEGEYNAIFQLGTNIGSFDIPVKASVYSSPIMSLDKTAIDVFTAKKEVITEVVEITNTGGHDLEYSTSYTFVRNTPSKKAVPFEAVDKGVYNNTNTQITSIAKELTTRNIGPKVGEELRRTIAHAGTTTPTHFDGFTAQTAKNVIATRYQADENGFNLSDIFTYFRSEDMKEGIIEVEVRIGDDIESAISVGKSSMEFQSETTDNQGSWYQLTLTESIDIYPNEEFFVLFTYPQELVAPQGVALTGVEPQLNTYYAYFEGIWYDLQATLTGYKTGGVCMMVGEKDEPNIGWINIKSNGAYKIPVDSTVKMEIELIPEKAITGSQSAIISFASNDSSNPILKLPVTLRLNSAPEFTNAPMTIYVLENKTDTTEMIVSDKDGDSFTVEAISVPEFVKYTYDETTSKVSLISKPRTGSKGSYKAILKATDSSGAINQLELPIEVTTANRAPIYISDIENITLSQGSSPLQLDINALFQDPDGDKLSFELESADETVMYVSKFGTHNFILEGIGLGETELKIVVWDPAGAVTTKVIPISIVKCRDPYDIINQKWNSVLLVNNTNNRYKAYQWYKNGLLLNGETKQYYVTKELDFTAEYTVQLITKDGTILHTCPLIPEHRENEGLNVYPSLVEKGQAVTIELDIDNIENDPMKVHVVNVNGNIMNTLELNSKVSTMYAPAASGVYMLVFESKEVSKVFKLIVQ